LSQRCFFSERFPSSLEAIGEVLPRALAALQNGDWVEVDQEFYAHLCLEEALVNAVVHGNRGDSGLDIRLTMTENGDFCVIRVYDSGYGFCPGDIKTPDPQQPDGRGICLIRHCMDDVTYDGAEHCLEMRMRRKALCQGG
jgi:anti-sigma regulatory factor (Ser/Thr protein kinase)